MKQWEHQSPDERYTVHIDCGGKPVAGIQFGRISSVDEEVMYWRKANHIHGWFVDNVQNGQDDCNSYYVDWDRLRELRDACYKVESASKLVEGSVYHGTVYDKEHPNGATLRVPGRVIEDATVAKELLPTTTGCFFGNTEYDEEYLDEVVRTHAWVVGMLDDHELGVPGDIVYSSSW